MPGRKVSAEDHGAWVSIVTGVFMAYTIFCLLARLLMRFTINGPLMKDDAAVAAATVCFENGEPYATDMPDLRDYPIGPEIVGVRLRSRKATTQPVSLIGRGHREGEQANALRSS